MMMMMTEMDIETSVYYIHLMQLIAREDYIKSINYDFVLHSGGVGEPYTYFSLHLLPVTELLHLK
jgi:hypothetical protein